MEFKVEVQKHEDSPWPTIYIAKQRDPEPFVMTWDSDFELVCYRLASLWGELLYSPDLGLVESQSAGIVNVLTQMGAGGTMLSYDLQKISYPNGEHHTREEYLGIVAPWMTLLTGCVQMTVLNGWLP